MEKTQTALQQLFDDVKAELDKDEAALKKYALSISEKEFLNSKIQVRRETLSSILAKLPVEKEQIEEAWNDANGHSFYEYGSEYYTNTYTDETK